jgi:hypothetical protein
MKPGTTEYFVKDDKRKDGLQYWCKDCYKAYRTANREQIAHRKKEHYQQNKESLLAKSYQWRRENPEKRKQSDRGYRSRNRNQRNEYNREWRLENPEKARDGIRRYTRRKRELPNTLTDEQWIFAQEYFDGKCAVCSNESDVEQDHWVPLTAPKNINPGTVAENIVPLCRSCNADKFNFMPHEFLLKHYDNIQSWIILKRIDRYFQYVRLRNKEKHNVHRCNL